MNDQLWLYEIWRIEKYGTPTSTAWSMVVETITKELRPILDSIEDFLVNLPEPVKWFVDITYPIVIWSFWIAVAIWVGLHIYGGLEILGVI